MKKKIYNTNQRSLRIECDSFFDVEECVSISTLIIKKFNWILSSKYRKFLWKFLSKKKTS